MRAPLYGLLLGILLDILFWMTGPINQSLLKFLTELSTPVAYIISWITGWQFQQEEGIMLHLLAILATLPLLGIVCGLLCSAVKIQLKRNREKRSTKESPKLN